jgi:hypothetical protein
MLTDAAGNVVPTDRCECGRHKPLTPVNYCCGGCPRMAGGPIHPHHSTACNMRQEHFRDTRQGVVAEPAAVLSVRTRVGFLCGDHRPGR